MKEREFTHWLLSKKLQRIPGIVSNCNRVIVAENVDLDAEFEKDQCRSLLARLQYSVDDERAGSPPRHKVNIDGVIRTGTATLKRDINRYVRFRKEVSFKS